MNTYEQVKVKADGLITHYRDDLLIHDKNAIEGSPGMPFLHFTGDTGTYIEFMCGPEDYPKKGERVPYLFGTASREWILSQRTGAVEHMKKLNRQLLVLFYPGADKDVREITQEEAEKIVWDYRHKMQAHWSKEDRNHGWSKEDRNHG